MKDALTLALNYRCNNDCGFCFLKPERAGAAADTGRAEIERIFARNARSRRYGLLIVSGAEATLRADLPELAAKALRSGGFSRVRLQTNGRRLSDPAYCRDLVGSGISEFLVSVHAASPALDARLTGVRGAFAQTRAGIRNIIACGAGLVSSTVVTRQNYAALPALAEFLLAEGVKSCQFWSFIELGNAGQAGCHVRFSSAVPRLAEALALLRGRAKVSLSWFPECLLGRYAGRLENYSSPTVICPGFERRMKGLSAFSCFYSKKCSSFGRSCLGIHERYREVFSDERGILVPRAARPLKGRKSGY